jgi:hypothetical protein
MFMSQCKDRKKVEMEQEFLLRVLGRVQGVLGKQSINKTPLSLPTLYYLSAISPPPHKKKPRLSKWEPRKIS